MAKLGKGRVSVHIRRRSGNMSEFAMCLLVFFLFALFPMINLIMFAVSCGTVALLTRNAAAAASTSATYGQAMSSAQTSITNDLSGGFGKFAKLTAHGGMNNSGVDLYVVATNLSGGANQVYGPNVAPTAAADTANFIYEYRASGNYIVQPFVNLSAVPFIGNVPVIGAAVPFNYVSERAVEDVAGINISGGAPVAAAAGGGPSGPGGGSTLPSGPGSTSGTNPPTRPGAGDSQSGNQPGT